MLIIWVFVYFRIFVYSHIYWFIVAVSINDSYNLSFMYDEMKKLGKFIGDIEHSPLTLMMHTFVIYKLNNIIFIYIKINEIFPSNEIHK